jgi:hypothetical protein
MWWICIKTRLNGKFGINWVWVALVLNPWSSCTHASFQQPLFQFSDPNKTKFIFAGGLSSIHQYLY